MTRNTAIRIRKLNENTAFQLLGRFAAVFAAVVLGPLTVWAIILLIGISSDVAVLKTRVETSLADPYRGADAKRDFARRDDATKEIRSDMADLKGRVATLEWDSAHRTDRPKP